MGRMPVAASGRLAVTASSGAHLVARIIASAQDGGARAKQNTNGATDPIADRRLSIVVRPGYRPCTSPAISITTKAQAGQSRSSLGPKRSTHRTASPIWVPLTAAMTGWKAVSATRS